MPTLLIMVPNPLRHLQHIMEVDPRGYDYDLHDGYGVGVRQAIAIFRRQVRLNDHYELNATLEQFYGQRRSPDTLLVMSPRLMYCVKETTMCIMHGVDDSVPQEGVERGRLLAFSFLAEIWSQLDRPACELDVHEAGMKAYAYLMDLAARQLDPESYEVWYEQWCQIPGQMPWALSEHAQERHYAGDEAGWQPLARL